MVLAVGTARSMQLSQYESEFVALILVAGCSWDVWVHDRDTHCGGGRHRTD